MTRKTKYLTTIIYILILSFFLINISVFATTSDFSKIEDSLIVTQNNLSNSSSSADIDNDGDIDLFLANSGKNQLYLNDGLGNFEVITESEVSSTNSISQHGAFGDYDNDGWIDLFVPNFGGSNYLYHNNQGSFSLINFGAIVEEDSFSRHANWIDYDNDGFLDLFIANMYGANFLYHNNGNGDFTKIEDKNIVYNNQNSFSSAEENGDLFVVNQGEENIFYRNNGEGDFTESIIPSGINSTSVHFADLNNDNNPDIFVTNDGEENYLLISNENGDFIKSNTSIFVNDIEPSRDAELIDMDQDGDLDIFVVNYKQNHSLYINDGQGNFTKELDIPIIENTYSIIDALSINIDNDHDLDLFLINEGDENNILYENESELYIPNQVENLTATIFPGKIKLNWDITQDTNMFDHYNVYRTEDIVNGEITKIAELTDPDRNFYLDIDQQNEELEYYYAVKVFSTTQTEIEEYQWIGPFKTLMAKENFISDGDFELSNNEQWRGWGRSTTWTKTSEKIYEGTQSLQVGMGETPGGVTQSHVPIDREKNYKISFWYKVNADDKLYYVLGDNSANKDAEEGLVPVFHDTDGQWKYHERFFSGDIFTTGNTVFRVSNKVGQSYIDDILIEEIEEKIYIKDGDFELRNSAQWKGWGRSTTWTKTSDEVYEGEQSLQVGMGETPGGVTQSHVPIDREKNYKISFWYKVNADDKLYYVLGDSSANRDAEEGLVPVFRDTNSQWKYHERFFSGDIFTTGNTVFRVSNKVGQSYIDNILIEEIEGKVYIKDGDFELSNSEQWRGWGRSTTWTKTSDEVYEGEQSLQVGMGETPGGVTQSHVPIDREKNYKISFWYKVNSGDKLYYVLGDSTANKDAEEGLIPVFYDTDGQWEYHERFFNGDIFTTGNTVFRVSNKIGKAYIDNILIEEI